VADATGRLVTATYYYDPSNEYDLGNLISVSTDGKLTILDEGFHLANGLGFSPDGSILYFTDSAARRIYRYDYNIQNGAVSNRRILVAVPSEEGLPDGLAVDSKGYIWSAQWYGGCIVRYDPDGKLVQRVRIPAKQTSSLTFGGPDLTYISSPRRDSQSRCLSCLPAMTPSQAISEGHSIISTLGLQVYHITLQT